MQSRGQVSVPALQGWRTTKWKAEKELQFPKGTESEDKNAVAIVKIVPHLGCVSQDSESRTLTLPSWRLWGGFRGILRRWWRPTARCKPEKKPRKMSKNWIYMLLEETPAVLSLGKLCEDHGYTYHWTSGQKPHHTQNDKNIDYNISNYVPFVVTGLSTSSSTTSTPTSSTSSSQE